MAPTKYDGIQHKNFVRRFSGKTVAMLGPLTRREYSVEIEVAETLERLGWKYVGGEIVESGSFLESTIFEC
jgi:hypothetical protein